MGTVLSCALITRHPQRADERRLARKRLNRYHEGMAKPPQEGSQPSLRVAFTEELHAIIILSALFLACCYSALTLFYARDEGRAPPDLANSWVVNAGNSHDILFSNPFPPPFCNYDPRRASWHRHSYGLPVQWLVMDHAPDYTHYYGRVDVGYAMLSVVTFFIPSWLMVTLLTRFICSRDKNQCPDK